MEGKVSEAVQIHQFIMKELPEKLQEADLCMYPEKTPHQVLNFVKFRKILLEGLTINLATIRRAQMP